MTQLNFLCSLILCCCVLTSEAGFIFRLFKLENGEFQITETEVKNKTLLLLSTDPNEVAKAYYEPQINKTG